MPIFAQASIRDGLASRYGYDQKARRAVGEDFDDLLPHLDQRFDNEQRKAYGNKSRQILKEHEAKLVKVSSGTPA